MTASRPIGIAANPASGKDVRRLVARASVFDNQEKRAIIRRALGGAMAAGCASFVYLPDSHGITEAALADVGITDALEMDAPRTGTAIDTTRAASLMRDAGCAVVLTLGGDGTNRAFALGWLDAPLLPISTGTNNVFPGFVEATVAGAAAALVATGRLDIAAVSRRAKRIEVRIEDERDDLALIDAVVTAERFVGARALLSSDLLRLALLTRADPAAVGMTSIGGLIDPLSAADDGGLLLELGDDAPHGVNAPIAPGLYQRVGVHSSRRIAEGESVRVTGPCVLAFDGERERVLRPGQRAELILRRDGPRHIDVPRAMAGAARSGAFRF